MASDLLEKWVNEAKKMIETAISNSQQSKNKVFFSIDSVGAITALVFGKEGIVSVEPCYDDKVAGKYAHRLAYPNEKKLKQIFSEKTGVTDVSFFDTDFQEFVIAEIEEQSNGADWDGVSWNHTYSRNLYDSMQEAVDAMWSKDVFEINRINIKEAAQSALKETTADKANEANNIEHSELISEHINERESKDD